MSSHDSTKNTLLISLLSGGIAGGVEGALTYPLEFAKTRIQLGDLAKESHSSEPKKRQQQQQQKKKQPRFRNPFSVAITVYRNEGIKSLYKGCSAQIIGSVGKDGVRFMAFDSIKSTFADPETGALTPARNLLAGLISGVCASVTAVTPAERIKTALIDDARNGATASRFHGPVHAVKTIVAEDGLVGLYRGFIGTTLKQASATACRLGSYNIIKDFESVRGIEQTIAVNFANGAVAGTIVTLVTQPFDTVKTRSQTARKTTTVQAVRAIVAEAGVRGFWRGTIMRLSRTVVSGGILFTTAESVAKVLRPLLLSSPGERIGGKVG
ncbi:MAG: hypothetical protein GOMPHAMPRED_000891 [Gomphillus americanus]|uniref:Tricarboxylate transport protein n=1 Tax=Gomphillus americanus TaxID=1940652 RepID=A0A8H3IJG5_9LECA|nr:MAG: hypothetical protein GOMPHAMPRED_000891 [Gomphillus americanus]